MLFTTKTCPNCVSAKALLDAQEIRYRVVDAEDNADLSRKLGIMQAPTLVVSKGDSVELIQNVSSIRKYIAESKMAATK